MESKVPGLMRLGLAGASSSRDNGAGFRFAASLKGDLLPFDKAGESGPPPLFAPSTSSGAAAISRRGGAYAEPFVPPKFALSGQKLTFKGFFQEGVPESSVETSRKRVLVIIYYLEDDTTEIVEPFIRNNGLPPGRFLKRMLLPGISTETMRLGSVIEVFKRSIRLVECDDFTRKFYDDLGMPQDENEDVGQDDWSALEESKNKIDPNIYHGVKSSAITRFIEATRGSQKTNSKKDLAGAFRKFDGMVLRFLVTWDDTKNNMFGEKYLFWLSYFLATEQCEIKENKGKKQFMGNPTLLSKMRLPKFVLAHDDRMRSCEDVTGDEDYYHEDDFRVGETIRVFGREMAICDCDEFTQQWYLENRGIDQKATKILPAEPESPRPKPAVPPHHGFGSEEDTLASWKSLIPKRPKNDMLKFLKTATGKANRFLCKLVTTDPINSERIFRITVYLDDQQVAVFEPPIRNSGVAGGVFQKKAKLRCEETHKYFTSVDFYVGATVTIKAHVFKIYEEERQPEEPVANIDVIIHTLKKKILDASVSLRKMFRKFDLDFSGNISFAEFQMMLSYYSLGLTKYEAITLFKAFEDTPGFMSYQTFMRAFDRAEYTVNNGRAIGVGQTADAMAASHSYEELDEMIEEAKSYAKAATYHQDQEVLLSRIARALKCAKTAQSMHENFRRFDINKTHTISRSEFRLGLNHFLALSEKEIQMLEPRFFLSETEEEVISYEIFMGVIHSYCDKVIRA